MNRFIPWGGMLALGIAFSPQSGLAEDQVNAGAVEMPPAMAPVPPAPYIMPVPPPGLMVPPGAMSAAPPTKPQAAPSSPPVDPVERAEFHMKEAIRALGEAGSDAYRKHAPELRRQGGEMLKETRRLLQGLEDQLRPETEPAPPPPPSRPAKSPTI